MTEKTAKQTWDCEIQSNSEDLYRQRVEDLSVERELFTFWLADASLQTKDCFDFLVHVRDGWLS